MHKEREEAKGATVPESTARLAFSTRDVDREATLWIMELPCGQGLVYKLLPKCPWAHGGSHY